MQIKVSRNYSVEFTEDEIIDGLCYLLSHRWSTTEAVQIASLIRNAEGGVNIIHTGTGVTLEFTYADKGEDEK